MMYNNVLKIQITIEITIWTFDIISTLALTINIEVANITYPSTYTPGSLPSRVGVVNINILITLNIKV